MMAVDIFLWWSGAVVWLLAGTGSLLVIGEKLLDWGLTRAKMKRDFLLWVYRRHSGQDD
jgi:hypothetical protein